MAQEPKPRSYNQTLGDHIDAFLSRFGIPNLKVGGPVLSMLEASAQSDFRTSQDIFNLLAANSLDNAKGIALDRIGNDENVPRVREAPSAGTVDISDSSFTKIASRVYQGRPAPIAGSSSIDVQDATPFPTTGSIYIGRNTSNYEGPLAYSSKVNNGTYWTLTLSSSTTKFHNLSESVIVAQGGNRSIAAGTSVSTPQANFSDAIKFSTQYAANIPDGETSVTSVAVTAQLPGLVGNVTAGALNQFDSPPFAGAVVTNALPFTNGVPTEDDDSYRDRIRDARRSRSLGTETAIRFFVTGITAPDENKRITSASVVTREDAPSVLYIDDGTGYEERGDGVAIETLMDDGGGGEQYFMLTGRPASKAHVVTANVAPFSIAAASKLAVKVGGQAASVHSFDPLQFVSIESASAYEVVSSINGNKDLLFSARTADGGTRVVLIARDDENEDLEVVAPDSGLDANDALLFPVGRVFTLRLYKNDRLLNKDGRPAVFESEPFAEWAGFGGDQTLVIAIDGTSPLSLTFVDQDFIDAQTGFTTVGKNSLAAWALVLNRKIPGVTTTVSGARLVLTSNKGTSSKAALEVRETSSLVSHGVFGVLPEAISGADRDYAFNRNTGQIKLVSLLALGDRLVAGTQFTRSFIESAAIAPTTLADATLWFSLDSIAAAIPTGVTGSTAGRVIIDGLAPWGFVSRFVAQDAPFANVHKGDDMVVWDTSADVPAAFRALWRVADQFDDNTIRFEKRGMFAARGGHVAVVLPAIGTAITRVLVTGGFSVVQSSLNKPVGATAAVDLYDPNTKTFTRAAPMGTARCYHTATLLNDGRVFVAGGFSKDGQPLTSTELYTPGTNTWTAGPSLATARCFHTATKLGSGNIFVAGGFSSITSTTQTATATSQVYVPGTPGTFNAQATGLRARAQHGAVLLTSGDVLLAGGTDFNALTGLNHCELFNPGSNSYTITGALNIARKAFGTIALAGASVMAAGNSTDATNRDTWETYSEGTGLWTNGSPAMVAKFGNNQLVRLNNPSAWIVAPYSYDDSGFPALAHPQYYDPGDNQWHDFGPQPSYKNSHTLLAAQTVLLTSADPSYQGHLLGCGGVDPGVNLPIAAAEQLDGLGNNFKAADAITGTGTDFTLSESGLDFVRSTGYLHKTVVPAASDYTAPVLAPLLASALPGSTGVVYRTNRLRLATNTHATTGGIGLFVKDTPASALPFDLTEESLVNLDGHVGSVETQSSSLGTPTFQLTSVVGTAPSALFADSLYLNQPSVDPGYSIVGRHAFSDKIGLNSDPITLTYSTPTTVQQGDPRYATTWFPDLTTLSDTVITVEVTINASFTGDPDGTDFVLVKYGGTDVGNHLDPIVTDGTSIGAVAIDTAGPATFTGTFTLVNPGPGVVPINATVHSAFDTDEEVIHEATLIDITIVISGAGGAASEVRRFGHNYGFWTPIGLPELGVATTRCDVRKLATQDWLPYDRLYLAAPYSIGPNDDLAVVVDENFDTLRFPISMFRRLKPSTNVYGSQNAFKDADNGNTTLATAFGIDYAFDDFMVHMRARAKLFDGDASRVGVARYYRLGPEGNNAQLRFTYADSENQPVSVVSDNFQDTVTNIRIKLASGPSRVGVQIRDTTRVGFVPFAETNSLGSFYFFLGLTVQSAARTAGNHSSLVLTLPTGVTGAGITVGDVFYFKSTDSNWTSGVVTINQVDAPVGTTQTVWFTNTALGTGAVSVGTPVGTLSADTQGETTFTGSNVVVGDILRVNTLSDLPPITESSSFRIRAVNPQYLLTYSNEVVITGGDVAGGISWAPIVQPGYFAIFQNKEDTVATIATAVNALGASPITITSTGTGTGTVIQSTTDENVDGTLWVKLSDGYNYVSQTILPPNTATDHSLTFKKAVTSTLATDADWINEDVRLTPINANTVVQWLNTPAATGLFTAAAIQETSDATKVQISTLTPGSRGSVEVQSGLANRALAPVFGNARAAGTLYSVASVRATDTTGLMGGTWVSVENAVLATKAGIFPTTSTFTLAADGLVTLSDNTIFTNLMPPQDVKVMIEKQGNYTLLVVLPSFTNGTFDLGGAQEGDWVSITAPASGIFPTELFPSITPPNIGIFRIVRFAKAPEYPDSVGAVWVENPMALEGDFSCNLSAFLSNSVMPGDLLALNTDKFGAQNKGIWTVESVGDSGGGPLTDSTVFRINPAGKTLAPVSGVAIGTDAALVHVYEATPRRHIKRILGIAPNATDPTYADVKFDTQPGWEAMSSSLGSVITALDKLDFPAGTVPGIDGYQQATGLIAEANRVVYGNPQNSSTYPGVAAAGAKINIQGPLVKRVSIALGLRVRSGLATTDIADRVRSAVASVVNRALVGQSVALSDVVGAASKVAGVISVTIISPNDGSDLIRIQPYEKALVLSLEQDVHVSFIGD